MYANFVTKNLVSGRIQRNMIVLIEMKIQINAIIVRNDLKKKKILNKSKKDH